MKLIITNKKLIECCNNRDYEGFEVLLKTLKKIHFDKDDETSFIHVIAKLNLCKFMFLLEEIIKINNTGIDLNIRDKNGESPLHIACKYRNIDIISILVKNCANIYMFNAKGYSPLYKLIQNNHDSTDIYFLISQEIKLLNILYFLNEVKYDFNRSIDTCGNTILHYLLNTDKTWILHYLLNIDDINVMLKNSSDVSALQIGLSNNNIYFYDLLCNNIYKQNNPTMCIPTIDDFMKDNFPMYNDFTMYNDIIYDYNKPILDDT